MSTAWKVAGELVGCIVIFSYSQAASNLFQVRSYLTKCCHDAVLIDAILTGKMQTTPSVLPSDLHERAGYKAHIQAEVMSSLQAWNKGKWISFCVTIGLIGLTSFMGPAYLFVSGLVAAVAGMTQSTSVRSAVIDEVSTLAHLVQKWLMDDDVGCKAFCFQGANENLFGNMYYVADRLEASENQ